MGSLPGRRAGIAILSVELEEKYPERMLIRVRTIADVIERRRAAEHVFADAQSAAAHVRDWLERWQAGDEIDPV